jgi:L-amino acid N-acyltransferase YncA
MHRIEPMKLAADWPAVQAIYAEGLATGLAAFMTDPPSQSKWEAGHLPFGRLVVRDRDTLLGWAALTPVDNT